MITLVNLHHIEVKNNSFLTIFNNIIDKYIGNTKKVNHVVISNNVR